MDRVVPFIPTSLGGLAITAARLSRFVGAAWTPGLVRFQP
jgi:hypothetical protein